MKLTLADIPTLRALYCAKTIRPADPAKQKFAAVGSLLDRVSLQSVLAHALRPCQRSWTS